MEVWPIFGQFRFDLFGETAYLYCLVVLFICWLIVRAHRAFAVRPLAHRHPRKYRCACTRSARRSRAAARRLHDLGGARRHLRRADRADDADSSGSACWASSAPARVLIMLIIGGVGRLYGAFIGVPLYMIAQDQFSSDRSGLLVFLDRAVHGADRGLRARRRARHARPRPRGGGKRTMSAAGARNRELCKSFGALRGRQRHRFPAGAGRPPRADRAERRRQDELRQSRDRRAAAERRAHPARRRRHHARCRRRRGSSAASCARSRSPRCSAGCSVLENVDAGDLRARGRRRRTVPPGGPSPRGDRGSLCAAREPRPRRRGVAAGATNSPMAASGWSRSRLRSASKPKVLLLDEPAAGVPSGESGAIIAMIERLPADIALLIIEHDMDLVFRLAQPHHRAGAGQRPGRGHAGGDRRRPARARGLSRRARAMSARITSVPECGLVLEGVRAGYGETVVLDGISLDAAAGRRRWPCSAATASARRRCLPRSWAIPRCTAARIALRAARRSSTAAAYRRCRLRHRLRAAGARDLSLAHRRGEPGRSRRGPGAGRSSGSTTSFPRSPSAAATAATSCPAASSRCWRSAAR